MADMSEAIDRVMAGPERRSRIMSEREKRSPRTTRPATPWSGHVLPDADPIHKVSIVARGRALGWTLRLPTEDRYTRTDRELRDQLAMLHGRAHGRGAGLRRPHHGRGRRHRAGHASSPGRWSPSTG